MATFTRNKQITNMLDDKARARLVGTINTGNTYSSDGDSLSLSYLVHGFLEEEGTNNSDDIMANEFDWDRVDSLDKETNSLKWKAVTAIRDPYRNMLLAHVSEAMENFTFLRDKNVSIYRKSVAAFLKEKGHDAAICVTSWDSSSTNGVTAGSHEFIDVVKSGSCTWRHFVELDFRAQFEIARPTRQFLEVLSVIPEVFVGEGPELKRNVSFLCDAVKRCFKSRGLAIPPWRKNRFMQNKWFAPCSRTVNSVQGKPVKVIAVNDVSCRLIGFDDIAVDNSRYNRGGVVRTK